MCSKVGLITPPPGVVHQNIDVTEGPVSLPSRGRLIRAGFLQFADEAVGDGKASWPPDRGPPAIGGDEHLAPVGDQLNGDAEPDS